MLEHKKKICSAKCSDCNQTTCVFCPVCNMPFSIWKQLQECPGEFVTEEQKILIELNELNFIDGKWVYTNNTQTNKQKIRPVFWKINSEYGKIGKTPNIQKKPHALLDIKDLVFDTEEKAKEFLLAFLEAKKETFKCFLKHGEYINSKTILALEDELLELKKV